MSTSIRSEATRSVVVVNGVDTMAINQDGSVELLVPNNTPTGNDVVSAVNFGSSLASNGYQRLPSGLIIQWGTTASVGSNGTLAVTFPLAFPSQAFSITTTGTMNTVNSGDAIQTEMRVIALSASSFTLSNDDAAQAVRWIAVGN